jgi:GRAM domain
LKTNREKKKQKTNKQTELLMAASSTNLPPNMMGEYVEEHSEEVQSKARKMRAKTEELRQRFNLPATEQVVQDYYCSLKKKKFNHGGRMWITQNYICFYSGLPFKHSEKISFRSVTAIEQGKGAVMSNNIDVMVDESGVGSHKAGQSGESRLVQFGSFLKTAETLNVLNHLWHNPPSYIQLDEELGAGAASSSAARASHAGGGGFAARGANRASQQPHGHRAPPPVPGGGRGGGRGGGDGWDQYAGGGGGGGAGGGPGGGFFQTQKRAQVDTDTSAQALRTALEAREMGVDTLHELSRQAEVIDRIEHDVQNIHANLDKGDRVLRGLETFGGGMKNVFTRDNTHKNNPVFNRLERTLHLKARVPEVIDVNILLKHDDDSLSPAVLRFHPDTFEVVDAASSKPIKAMNWTFKEIDQIVLRARPLHIDVRYNNEKPRFRMMTAFCQPITNELFLRAIDAAHMPQVVFEPNVTPFDYGSYKLSLMPTSKKDRRAADNQSGFAARSAQSSVYAAGNAQFRVANQASDVLSAHVDADTKRAFDEQEHHVDALIEVSADLEQIAHVMGDELDRSNQQLQGISQNTATAVTRVHHSNWRIKQQL